MMVGLIRATKRPDQPPEGEKPMLKNVMKLLKDEEGATAVEYGLIVAAIAGLIIAVVFVLGGKVKNNFNNIQAVM
jgi:pilus assembly protein Flp/PilA